MKISLTWLKELVNYGLSPKELADKLSLVSIGVKEQTEDYLELDLTYNRGDLLSMQGVTREIAAITGSKILFSTPATDYIWEDKNLSETPVEIKNQDLCPVYCIAKIENLNVAPSPTEWVDKLKKCGVRSVNNVADITNLIMLEYGQPMHSFDEEEVKDGTIIVRTANQGEKLITLDGKQRILDKTDLLIADPEKALGLAGIMGGKNSEITEKTTTILLEAAIFNPVSNRQTSKRHGLYSEATKRFQHGLTRTDLLQALNAAIKMYEALGGKLTALTLKGSLEDKPRIIELSQNKIDALIGVEIPPRQIESSLKALGFHLAVRSSGNVNWEVTVPYWRLDINIEEDLIEEVARMYGYEKIEGRPLEKEEAIKLDQSFYKFIYDLKNILKEAGLTEVQTYSFYSSAVLDNLNQNKDRTLKIANPISLETAILRENLWPNLLEVTAKNIRKGIKEVAIFEIGKVYSPKEGDLPNESYHLSIALSNGTDNPIEELIIVAKSLGLHLKVANININKEYLHPTRFAALEKDDKQVGWIGEIHPRVVNKFGLDQRVAVLEIEITAIQ